MRSIPILSSSCAFLLLATTAFAGVKEPNGASVPQASPDPVQLNTFFMNQGEPIDWVADAASTPNSFSPLCGFNATFLLHGADCPLDFAWYNETGQPPSAADLHVIIPAGSPVGTMFAGTDIKVDPAYKGGLVGFALVGNFAQFCTQSHYSNPAWNQVCTSCNPVAPWITTLIYPSKKQANGFYLAFEDGPTSNFAFNNDGDFNDDVYFVTGVTCVGGGQPCDTGKPGICGPGITQCTAQGTICQQLNQPSPKETCNGLDDDCNGTTDEGNICPQDYVCDKGTCVKSCSGGEFACAPGEVCNADGFCVDPKCAKVTCPSGEVCVDGLCKGPCDDTKCPYPQVCRVGACVDPCNGVSCAQGQVCDTTTGVCVATCDCQPCSAGKQCDPQSGLCEDPGCVGKMCAAGQHCVSGGCVDDCQGAVCPKGQACQAGQCIPVPSGAGGAGVSSSVGFDVGGGSPSSNSSSATGSGANGSGGAGGAGGAGGGGNKGSCGCRVVGEAGGDELAFAGVALAFAAASLRRRRRYGA